MIREFFVDELVGIPFVLFSLNHFLLVVATILGIVIMHKNRNKLFQLSGKLKRNISLALIAILFTNMTVYYSSLAYYGQYDWKVHLPLHLCFISGYLFMYSVLTNKVNLYKKVYFYAFIGPIPAMLFPDLKSSFDSFLFYQQVISHHIFLLSSLFIFYAYNVNIKVKDMFKSLTLGLSIFAIMYIFNYIFGTNYIMQNKLPDHVLKLFPFLVDFGHPIFVLLTSGILVMLIAYLPIYFKNKKDNDICLQGQESLL